MTQKISAAMTDPDLATQAELDVVSGVANAAAAAAALKLSGDLVQVVNSQTGAVATGSTAIPLDDTIPQSAEGDQYLSLAITPTNAANILLIDVLLNLSCTGGGTISAALFQDLTANALHSAAMVPGAANGMIQLRMAYRMVAGTTAATTFKVRAGAASSVTLNGSASARLHGGVLLSSITIREIKA